MRTDRTWIHVSQDSYLVILFHKAESRLKPVRWGLAYTNTTRGKLQLHMTPTKSEPLNIYSIGEFFFYSLSFDLIEVSWKLPAVRVSVDSMVVAGELL